MNEQHINYEQLLRIDPEKDVQERRQDLLNRLKQGIEIDFEDEKIVFQTMETEVISGIMISSRNSNQRIGWVIVDNPDNQQVADGISVYYDEKTIEKFKGKGLMTAAGKLLYQVLNNKHVIEVKGITDLDNDPAIKGFLNQQDLLLGGYYELKARIIDAPSNKPGQPDKKVYEVSTIIKDGPRRSEPMSMEEALNNWSK